MMAVSFFFVSTLSSPLEKQPLFLYPKVAPIRFVPVCKGVWVFELVISPLVRSGKYRHCA